MAVTEGTPDLVEDAWTYDPAGALGQPLAAQRTINGATERWTGQA